MGFDDVAPPGRDTVQTSIRKLWNSTGLLSDFANEFIEKYGTALINWIPYPEDEKKVPKVAAVIATTGAMVWLAKHIQIRNQASQLHLPFSPWRLCMNRFIFNVQKITPFYKTIFYYFRYGYEYHSTSSADEIKRIKKHTRAQYEELIWAKKTLPYCDLMTTDASMLKLQKDFSQEEYTDTVEHGELPDDDEILLLAYENMIRSLGHIPRKVKMEILDKAARMKCRKNYQLFRVGDMDDAMYFVVNGKVEILFHSPTTKRKNRRRCDAERKIVRKGDHIHSFFSFLDAVTGYKKSYKTIEARCIEDSEIVKVPFALFKEYWLTDGPAIVAGMRSILMRIYHINYIVFDQVFGLRNEFSQNDIRPTETDLTAYWDTEEGDKNAAVGSIRRLSGELEKRAMDSIVKYFGVPEDAREILKTANVLSVDVCHGTGPSTIDYFYYIYKGVVEIYKMRTTPDDDIVGVNVDISDCHEADEALFAHENHVLYLYAGETVGGRWILTGDTSFYYQRVLCKSILVQLPLETFTRLLEKYPQAIYPVCQEFIMRVSKFVRQMDFCLEWRRLDSGDYLFHTMEGSDDTYVVLNGLLKSQRRDDSGKIVEVGLYKRRDWIGLVESLTGKPRTKAVLAQRETELAKLPSGFINSLKRHFPQVAPTLMSYLAKRVLKKYGVSEIPPTFGKRSSAITIVPVSGYAPTYVFACDLMKTYCCETGGSAIIVTEKDVCRKLNIPDFIHTSDVFVNDWLSTLEDRHDLIIYLIDAKLCPWSYKCCSASDTIMGVVTSKDLQKEIREVETFYDTWSERSKKELVICHESIKHPAGVTPFGTKGWLLPRPWLHRHHHVRYPPAAFKFATVRDRAFVQEFYTPLQGLHDKHSDVARIVRWLSGRSTGVVFGSSTLEGMGVYIGAIQAIECFDMPVDMICGAGWSSLIAALYSIHQDSKIVERKTHWVYQLLTDKFLLLQDLVIPFTSQYQGALLNHCYQSALGDIGIEDLIIPFFVNTTDISSRIAKLHTCGTLWKLARAAATRIRIHPPMCDPQDGGYLVDGSYCHPVPVNLMRKFGAAFVITVEIGSPLSYNVMECPIKHTDQTTPVTYTEMPSFFDIRNVLSAIQSTFHQKKLAVKDKYNMKVSVDISTDEDPEDIDFELYYMLVYKGYAHMFSRLKVLFADPIDNNQQFWDRMHTEEIPVPQRVDDNADDCHRLLYEEKLRYQRNDPKEIIENFETSNLQFLRAGQLL